MGVFRRITLGWELGMASWRILLDHKVLMIFPLLSMISTVMVFAVFATGGAVLGLFTDIGKREGPAASAAYLIGLFLVYAVFNTIAIFFNVALISHAGPGLERQARRPGGYR